MGKGKGRSGANQERMWMKGEQIEREEEKGYKMRLVHIDQTVKIYDFIITPLKKSRS